MKKFYFDKSSENKEYGIYESLMENQRRIEYNNDDENILKEKYSKLKSLGAINKDKYVLFVGDIDKSDHIKMVDWSEKILGEYNFWFSFWYNGDNIQKLNIYYTTKGEEKNINEQLTELETIMSVISESILYNNINIQNEWNLIVSLPSYLLTNENNQYEYSNLGQCLSVIQKKYNELKSNYINDNPDKVKILSINKKL